MAHRSVKNVLLETRGIIRVFCLPLWYMSIYNSTMGIFKKIFGGLAKTASAIGGGIASIFVGTELDDDFYDDLTAVLLQSDMGPQATDDIIENVRKGAKKQGIKTQEELKEILSKSISDILSDDTDDDFSISDVATWGDNPLVLMVVGVNGVGKTTSIGKLSNYYKSQGKSVLVVAGDTFRAAASEQLGEWAGRSKVRIVKHAEGADPASVVFDALESAKAKKESVVIIDTAGRLHNKAHLMDELKKIDRVVMRNYPDATYKKLLVIDGTTGQNGLSQVEVFDDAVELDGIVLTKLDGTAKGGVAIAIKKELGLPVVFVGVGEGIDDLLPFDVEAFARGIVGV